MYLCEHTNQVNLLQAENLVIVAREYDLPWYRHHALRMGLIPPGPGKRIPFRRYNFNCAS